MRAFHGDPAVKDKYLVRLKAHHAADEIVRGVGYNGSQGCAVGCTLNAYDHRAYEHELGLPQWLAHIEDRIFEGLPPVEAQQFAVDFLESVPVGADVDKVRWQLAIQRHTQAHDRLLSNKEPYAAQCIAAINLVIAYCVSEEKTEAARAAAWASAWSARAETRAEAARAAAWPAARAAAWAAARAAAESAESAARSAESAAESAAWSAAWSARAETRAAAWPAAESAESAARSAESAAWSAESAAWSAESAAWSARSNHYRWEAKTLLELLRAAPQAA